MQARIIAAEVIVSFGNWVGPSYFTIFKVIFGWY